MRDLPRGTVTLLFTDIEGSTRLLHEVGDDYANVLADHRRVLRDAFRRHGGVEVDTQGDAFFYVFASAQDAAAAAAAAQKALEEGPVRVRIGVHTGEPVVTDEGYVGVDVHRAARIMSAGHGGQVVVSETTRAHLKGDGLVDLGLHRLKDLGQPEKLFQLGADEFPPLKTLDATNLPVAASPLLGRERELAELLPLLQDGTRLLTITGPGGTGKTRLALQVAAELVGSLADGVFWVPLAALNDPELVMPTISQTIGAQGDLREHLRGKQLLLLLDNAEHLLPAAPGLAELLAISPKLRFLVTSRAPLHVSAEREYPLDPLPPTDAATLFVERARAVGRDLPADATVEAICRRLDGLPLAVELAAARTRLLDPETLLERLDNALPLLTGGARDAPERQRTLRATIEWSYDLLDEAAKRLFANLSVFVGTFSLESAESVSDAELDTLTALVELNLLKPIGDSRFLMLETVREYATERLLECEDSEVVSTRHVNHFLRLAAVAAREYGESESRSPFDRLSVELDDVRVALDRASRSQPDWALRVAVDLWPFWSMRNPQEGRRVVERAYRRDADVGLRLEALAALSHLAWVIEDIAAAQSYAEERLLLARSTGDLRAVAASLSRLSGIAIRAGDAENAERLNDEAIDVATQIDDPTLLGKLFWTRAAHEDDYGDPDRAFGFFERALEHFSQAGDQRGAATSRSGMGVTLCRQGNWHNARPPLIDGLRAFHVGGDTRSIALSLDHLAAVAARTGAALRAARLFGAGDAAWSAIGSSLEDAYRPPYICDAIEAASAALGQEDFERERARGIEAGVDAAVREELADA